ncbi:Ankyrin repeat family regulator of chromosome condensation (RCC1) family isoform 1 [Olea europaea subsp. europaea]|uniref:Ankyrin repeat family regulator of chromosome condensation (RCC1) family isoform 1 n=2 Tax=Olea europaea subsp. europaea TaxID=158383 RepID=A0A8S0T6P8_OLEEU|nr:Ankyrin repeat family regulator of chromosome condensation (RCC1) family isoform 1 [Olea europaea subsp. europaea]
MEELILPPFQKQSIHTSRRCAPSSKDIWVAVREGSVSDVDSTLALLKKNGGNINARNSFGLTLLHIATWRNHVPIVRRLLAAGADPNARDGESGWSSLHRALHFGHLAVACVLLQSGASITLEDLKSRTPVDLLSGPVMQAVGKANSSVATEVFSWGSGVNYQLGTGNAHIQKLPCKVDSLHGSFIKLVSASKFHSVAVTALGEVYTWGFGRGGRLGHPDFDIHSGQAAVITPRQVTSGLGARRVKAVAAAKHHTVVATESGEVFTWGSNREGQLGYTSVDTQPTPRRVSSLKSKIVSVAAANKHTAVVSEAGEVYTWGCNKEGQLGYGTSNSASNYIPRVVEYLKGKVLTGVAAAKYHTIVLGSDGEVFTWGHRLVTPRRVVIARNIKKGGNTTLKFHRKERLNVVAIAAGMTHSMALTDDGALFFWVSSDPDFRCRQLYSLCGGNIVSVSAGKYWSGAVTVTGDVYMWDGKKVKDAPPALTRLHGVKKATSVSVGETHLLIVTTLYHPGFLPSVVGSAQKLKVQDELDELHEGFAFSDLESEEISSTVEKVETTNCAVPSSRNYSVNRTAPSLKSFCEKMAAEHLVEPRNSIQLLEIADSLGADDLRKHCEDIAIRNLDYILTISAQVFASISLDILVCLEKLLDKQSSEPWSYRRLPTPTATFPVIINSEDEDGENDLLRTRDHSTNKPTLKNEGVQKLDSFLQPYDVAKESIFKQVRALRKKLQQIELLEEKLSRGHPLDDQQILKLQMRPVLQGSLFELGVPTETVQTKSVDEKDSKKGVSRKQRRKSKQKAGQMDEVSSSYEINAESNPINAFFDIEISQVTNKEKDAYMESAEASQAAKVSQIFNKNAVEDIPKGKTASPASSKKKNKKGGLSMFLSGALDDVPKSVAPPPVIPKIEGPAWGGAKISKGSTSLRDIQDEQSKTKAFKHVPIKYQVEELSDGCNVGKPQLSSFLPSTPIPMVPGRTTPVSEGERNTPPWAASGTPPSLSRPSLRDIQLQQGKHQQGIFHSPKTRTTGFSVMSGQGSPSESGGGNRWFKPEIDAPSSIRSIQIEERAMKDLKRFYSSVRIVNNQS